MVENDRIFVFLEEQKKMSLCSSRETKVRWSFSTPHTPYHPETPVSSRDTTTKKKHQQHTLCYKRIFSALQYNENRYCKIKYCIELEKQNTLFCFLSCCCVAVCVSRETLRVFLSSHKAATQQQHEKTNGVFCSSRTIKYYCTSVP